MKSASSPKGGQRAVKPQITFEQVPQSKNAASNTVRGSGHIRTTSIPEVGGGFLRCSSSRELQTVQRTYNTHNKGAISVEISHPRTTKSKNGKKILDQKRDQRPLQRRSFERLIGSNQSHTSSIASTKNAALQLKTTAQRESPAAEEAAEDESIGVEITASLTQAPKFSQ